MRRCVRLQYLGNFFVCQFAIFCITLFPMRCIGQDGSTSLHGFVEDSSGARIPAALVVVTSPETGF